MEGCKFLTFTSFQYRRLRASRNWGNDTVIQFFFLKFQACFELLFWILSKDNGIDVLELDGVELMKGRGGARCMTFPMRRSLSLEV